MIKGQLTDTDRTEIVKYRLEKAYRTSLLSRLEIIGPEKARI